MDLAGLLQAVAKEYGLSKQALTGPGRQREWIEGRRLLVYVAREWGKITTKELGKRLGRDPSMISRLSRDYEEGRDRQRERKLAHALSGRVQTQA